MLEVRGLRSGYAGALAIDDISFQLNSPGRLAMLGRNGAGKSTTLKTIMGLIRPWSGTITFYGTDITGWSSDRIARAGIGYVPEDRRVFPSLSVSENLETGAKPGSTGTAPWSMDKVFHLFPEIARRRSAAAGTLSGGERQMLAIGRAMLARPKLMMLDEPSLGLSPILVSQLFKLIKDLNLEGLTMILVEQNTNMALATAMRGYVLELGAVVLSGPSSELASDSRLEEAYLGG